MPFPTTRWSLIVASGDRAAARAAWGELAERYRASIVAYFRCRYGADRAEDLASAFFIASIEGGWWSRADIERGSFRTYLRMLLHRFGARHGDEAALQEGSDRLFDTLADAGQGPEQAYDRAFAHTLVALAMARLRMEVDDDPACGALFEHLLDRGDPGDLKQIAQRQGLLHNTLLQRLRRMRLRLRELLREEFAQLVIDPASIDAEMKSMLEASSRA